MTSKTIASSGLTPRSTSLADHSQPFERCTPPGAFRPTRPGLILRGWRIEFAKKVRIWLLVTCPYSDEEWAIPPQGWLTYARSTWICPCCQVTWGLPDVGVPGKELPRKGRATIRLLEPY